MRRQIRPFTIERKRTTRAAGAESAPLLDLAPPPAPAPIAPQRPEVHRFAAAEALFAAPAPAARTEPTGPAKTTITGRILPSLVEPPAAAPDLPEEQPRRRGRKPGSRNKAREPLHGEAQGSDPQRSGAQGPKSIDAVMRNLFEFWAAEGEQADEAPAPGVRADAAEPAAPLHLRRRSRLARNELPRGQRWKARLPKYAR
jgi:hypothetical protein